MKKVLVLLATGFEEVEAITAIDFLRRAGLHVHTLAVGASLEITGGHAITVKADAFLSSWSGVADAIVIPGGAQGSKNLAASTMVNELIRLHATEGKLVAAICAAPAIVLEPLGLLKGSRFTCFPGLETQVKSGSFTADRVVQDEQLITSRGAGTAAEFAEAIITELVGAEAARELHINTVQKD